MTDNLPERDDALDYGALLDESLAEMEAIARGTAPTKSRVVSLLTSREVTVGDLPSVDAAAVVAMREGLGVSQSVFAKVLNVSASLVRAWERGARTAEGPALLLLHLLDRDRRPFFDRILPATELSGRLVLLSSSTGPSDHSIISMAQWKQTHYEIPAAATVVAENSGDAGFGLLAIGGGRFS